MFKTRVYKIALLVLVLMVAALALPASAQNVPCYFDQGGGKFVAVVHRAVGCEWEMQTGTTLDIQSGVTATFANNPTFSGNPLFSGAPSYTGAADFTYVQGIDAGAVGDSVEVAFTSPIDTAGSNTHNAYTVDLAIGNATGGTNNVRGLQIDDITGDAEVTETGINIGTGWDVGLAAASPADFTYVQGIDAGAAADSLEVAFTSPIDTAGSNTHNALTVDLVIGNATGGTNNVRGLQVDSITGDAEVIETAINVEAGWDVGLAVNAPADFTYVQGIDAGAAGDALEVVFTSPIDTAGTNTHNAVTIDLAIGNSTAGTNNVVGIQIDAIVDDPQVVETAFKIGDEWDVAIDTALPIVGTAVTWMDDFLGDTVLAQYTEVSGSDAEAVQAIQEEQFGVYQLTSGDVGNTAADLEAVYLSLEWQADQGALIYEVRLHLDTAITTVEVCAGFTDDVSTVELPFTNSADTVTAVADDAVMFCFDTGSTTVEWFVNGAAAGTEATGIAAAGVAPAQDVYQTLRIEIDDGGADCRFYIDGTLVGTLTANCVTNTDLLAPGVVISSGGAVASHVLDVDYMYAAAARD